MRVKSAHKMWVKLTPGVNFINILRSTSAHMDPKRAAQTVNSSQFVALLGSACVKAARNMLMKLSPSSKKHDNDWWEPREGSRIA